MSGLTDTRRIELLEESVAHLTKIIEGLPIAYTSKLQWKQLDTLRAGEAQSLTDTVTGLAAEQTSLKARVTILETPTV